MHGDYVAASAAWQNLLGRWPNFGIFPKQRRKSKSIQVRGLIGPRAYYMNKLFTISALLVLGYVGGASQVNSEDNTTQATETSKGRTIGDFLTPDGRFDLEAARRTGYEGPLDVRGFHPGIDSITGLPMFMPSGATQPSDDPDDVYWDNSISPSMAGVGGDVCAAIIYDGDLVIGGAFDVVGDLTLSCIASWDGSSWSHLSTGINGVVYALTVYEGKLIAAGYFYLAGGVWAPMIAAASTSSSSLPPGRMCSQEASTSATQGACSGASSTMLRPLMRG